MSLFRQVIQHPAAPARLLPVGGEETPGLQPVEKGIEIMHSLTSSISGYAVPKYAIDLPVGGGKVTLGYDYIVSKEDKELVLENYLGKLYRYPIK